MRMLCEQAKTLEDGVLTEYLLFTGVLCVDKGKGENSVADILGSGPLKKSFLWIKQHLDPSWSYIIIENDENPQESSLFKMDHTAYTCLKKEKYTWQQVIDMDVFREYLVIRIPPEDEDKLLGRIMGFGFPENTVYYLYKAEEKSK